MSNKKKPRRDWNGTPVRTDVTAWHWVGRSKDGSDMIPAEWICAADADEGVAGWGIEDGPHGSVDTMPEEMPRYYPFYFGACPRPDAAREMSLNAYDKAANRLLDLGAAAIKALEAKHIHGGRAVLEHAAYTDAVRDVIHAAVREISPRVWGRMSAQEKGSKDKGGNGG